MLFIPAPTECAPLQCLPPRRSSRGPWDARGCQQQTLHPSAGPAAAPGSDAGSRTRAVLPAPTPWTPCPQPAAARPPHRPPGTHSFSRARSPRKEPFSSTVILLLLSSLWEEQRQRGSPVTPPAPSTRRAGRALGMARLGSPGCATRGVVAMVKSQGPTCSAGWGHRMHQPRWDVVPWSTHTAAAGWRCPGPCRLTGHLSCARAWVRAAAHGSDEMPPAPKPGAPQGPAARKGPRSSHPLPA